MSPKDSNNTSIQEEPPEPEIIYCQCGATSLTAGVYRVYGRGLEPEFTCWRCCEAEEEDEDDA
jgi:hypothetical protein